jgi:long-chain acyl-CoA synthetase
MGDPQTLPQYFVARTKQFGGQKIAVRQKKLGVWREFTWEDSYKQVKSFALGLTARGAGLFHWGQ